MQELETFNNLCMKEPDINFHFSALLFNYCNETLFCLAIAGIDDVYKCKLYALDHKLDFCFNSILSAPDRSIVIHDWTASRWKLMWIEIAQSICV